jgi:predicted ATPase/signal transduction histidine kinase
MTQLNNHSLLKDYEVGNTLLSNDHYEICLGKRLSDGKKIALKKSVFQKGDLMSVSKLGHEYDIMKGLDHPGIPKAYDFQFDGKTAVLVEEFAEGKSLRDQIFKTKLSYDSVLDIAIKLTDILHYLHGQSVIHKDISPGNIVVADDGKVRLVDYGISSNLYSESNEMLNIDKIEGTLNYISPEQTGRTVYSVTSTCDFYSFGILLYELLAGKLPFDSIDPLEVIHFHLSRKPLPLNSILPDLPTGLEKVVFKLIEKNPDDRYETAAGLKADLELIREHKSLGTPLEEFKPGLHDLSFKYKQTQKLYGREDEIKQLSGYYKNLGSVKSMMALVSGYSGVGKSALIRQVKYPIIQKNGTFISGKFDQLKKDIPYYAFIEAIREFIKNLLSEPEDKINAWKHRITSVLGENASLITDVIPQLTLIIGDQTAVAKLQPAEQESRFNMVLLDFIHAFSTANSPLVIFLDDLQWADLSSLNLVKRILENPRDESIMILGAYRDNEVHQGHPLMITLNQIQESDGLVAVIHLEPLDIQTTIQITADSFGMKKKEADELGRHVYSKTQGNPFFIHSFLKSLFDKQLITYDPETHWSWDGDAIEALGYTANVVDLMTNGLTELPGATQKDMQYAAVLGNTFALTDLADITEKSETEIYDDLKPAIRDGYIRSIDFNYRTLSLKSSQSDSESFQNLPAESIEFTFSHDKVQQAAYRLISDVERPFVHLKTGRQLLRNRDESQLHDDIFEVVNHFVSSAELIKDRDEKNRICELCLIAGRKAKDSNSYSLAVRFLAMAADFLSDDSWETHYDLTYNILVELGECEYLNDNPDSAEKYFEIVLEHAKTRFEKLKVYYIHSSLYLKIGNSLKSLELGLEAARLYDINFPKNKKTIQAATGIRLAKYLLLFSTKYKNPESLYHLEKCENEEIIALNKFLIDLATSAYQQDQNLMMLVIFKIIDLYIKHGFTDASGWGFSGFSVVVHSALKLHNKGFDLWDITIKLHQRTESPLIKWRLNYTVLTFHNHWRIPLRESYDRILDTIKACVLNGDQIFTSYSVALYLRTRLNAGDHLDEVLHASEDHISLIKNSKGGYDFFECFYQLAKALNGQTFKESWDDDSFDGDKAQKRLEDEGNRTKLGFFHSAKCNYLYMNENFREALVESKIVHSYADNFIADIQEVSYAFYTSLSIAACYDEMSRAERKKYRSLYKKHLRNVKNWVAGSFENFSQHYHLLKAELSVIENNFENAIQSFEEAIRLSEKHGFKNVEAIANERAAAFCRKTGLDKQCRFYVEAAWDACYSWGAHAKCRKLEERYPEYLIEKNSQVQVTRRDSTTSTSSRSELDLASVMKASQSIASQVKYGELLNNLMQITIENAGAERGCLVLYKKNQLCIEAIGISGTDIIEIFPSTPIHELQIMPETILNYSWRAGESVVLDDAQSSERFSSDPFFKKTEVLSVMCLPITALGNKIGLLYLENSLIEGVFNKDRIELLQMLSGQIGISIENANLYSNLEEKVKERTREIEKAYGNLEVAHENLKSVQEQLIQQEKLASLGQLTAGIAHEIKNPLNFVNNFSDVSMEMITELVEAMKSGDMEEAEEVAHLISNNLKIIHDHGSRADSIVKSMLQHSRSGSGEKEPAKLNALVREFVNLSYHGMRAGDKAVDVELDLQLDESIGEVPLMAEDFSRVIVNLCNNAFDAMREKAEAGAERQSRPLGAKRETSLRQPAESAEAERSRGVSAMDVYHPKLTVRTHQAENTVTIDIEDNGPGIPAEMKDKILHPFFTTKKGTAGTGLGLSITNDIIKAHGGSLDIESSEGKTVFSISIQNSL